MYTYACMCMRMRSQPRLCPQHRDTVLWARGPAGGGQTGSMGTPGARVYPFPMGRAVDKTERDEYTLRVPTLRDHKILLDNREAEAPRHYRVGGHA